MIWLWNVIFISFFEKDTIIYSQTREIWRRPTKELGGSSQTYGKGKSIDILAKIWASTFFSRLTCRIICCRDREGPTTFNIAPNTKLSGRLECIASATTLHSVLNSTRFKPLCFIHGRASLVYTVCETKLSYLKKWNNNTTYEFISKYKHLFYHVNEKASYNSQSINQKDIFIIITMFKRYLPINI